MLHTLFTMHDIPSRKMCVVSVLKYIQYTCVSTTCIYACTCLPNILFISKDKTRTFF